MNLRPPPLRWFLHDMEAVKVGHRDKNAQSWYTQLSRVASGVLVQSILMGAGQHTKGGSKVLYDQKRLRQVLERIATPPRTDQPPAFPHFPTATCSIGEWVEHFATIQQNEEFTTHSIPPTKEKTKAEVVATQDDKFAEIQTTFENNDKKDEFTPAKLQQLHYTGVMKTLNSHNAISAQMQGIGTTLFALSRDRFRAHCFLPSGTDGSP